MSMTSLLTGWSVPSMTVNRHIRTYSTTADILSYKRCRRQYGFFKVRGFCSATATQRYFGTLVHDVLDRIHRDYRSGSTALPDMAAVEKLVADAHERLIRSGVRPYNSKQQQKTASKLIWRFLHLLGRQFFPHVQQTEYRLERTLKTMTGRDYVLNGVVDVLSGAVSHALALPYKTTVQDVEIWDYKSGDMPVSKSMLRDYEYQMRVYAELYRQQTGMYPARSVLVFIGELGNDHTWDMAGGNALVYKNLIYVIHPHATRIAAAVTDFHNTVDAIETEREQPFHCQWLPPTHPVDRETCEACEIRYSCPRFTDASRQRTEPL